MYVVVAPLGGAARSGPRRRDRCAGTAGSIRRRRSGSRRCLRRSRSTRMPKYSSYSRSGLALRLAVPRQVEQGCEVGEHEPTTRSQQAGRLREGAVGVAERHRAVVAEHDVERPRHAAAPPRPSRRRAGMSTPCSICSRRACRSWARDWSSPTGRAPARASATDHCAAPHPYSRTSRPTTSPSAWRSASGMRQTPQARRRAIEVRLVDGLVSVGVARPRSRGCAARATSRRRAAGELDQEVGDGLRA